LTDCTVFEQCNDIYNNYYTPSSGSDTYVEQDTQSQKFAVDASWCPPLQAAPPAYCYSPPKPQVATGVLASETPGLPQPGIDYEEDSFPANFFMNPFAVSFPGDIAHYGDLGMPLDHVPDDDDEETLEGTPSDDHHRQAGGLREGVHRDASAKDTSLSASPRAHPPNAGITRSSTSGSKQSSPLINVINASPSPLTDNTYSWPSPPGPSNTNTPPAPTTFSSSKPSSPPQNPANNTAGGFQFVDASDRKTIVRLRNTMVSRKHRDNKVQRIKELEKMLEERDRELEELRRKVGERSG